MLATEVATMFLPPFLPPPFYRPATEGTTTFLTLPRETRNTVYSHIIATAETDDYNDCGIGLAFGLESLMHVCKKMESEFIDALLDETRVALQVNMDKRQLLHVTHTVQKDVRRKARALAIDVGEDPRPLFSEENPKDIPHQEAVFAIIRSIELFPNVRDVAVSVKLRNTANVELAGLLQKELEQLSQLKEYRVYTHAFPSQRQYRESRDWVRGTCMITWVTRVLHEGEWQWKPRVIDNTQRSAIYPVFLIYGEE